jgi:peptidoglycan/LPS O-acetylase OafA/YrhL
LLAAAAVVGGASFALRCRCVLGRDVTLSVVQFGAAFRLDSMMFGVAAASLAARHPARWAAARRPAAVAGLALVASAAASRMSLPLPGAFERLLYFDVAAVGAALVLPWLSGWGRADGPAAAAVTRVSLSSYSIDLVNQLLRDVAFAGLGTPWGPRCGAASAAAWLVATLGLSALGYHLSESRMTRLRDTDWRGLATSALARARAAEAASAGG